MDVVSRSNNNDEKIYWVNRKLPKIKLKDRLSQSDLLSLTFENVYEERTELHKINGKYVQRTVSDLADDFLRGLDKLSGVYFIYDKYMELTYIGHSQNLRNRLRFHEKFDEGLNYFNVIQVDLGRDRLESLEYHLIDKFKPPLNKLIKNSKWNDKVPDFMFNEPMAIGMMLQEVRITYDTPEISEFDDNRIITNETIMDIESLSELVKLSEELVKDTENMMDKFSFKHPNVNAQRYLSVSDRAHAHSYIDGLIDSTKSFRDELLNEVIETKSMMKKLLEVSKDELNV